MLDRRENLALPQSDGADEDSEVRQLQSSPQAFKAGPTTVRTPSSGAVDAISLPLLQLFQEPSRLRG